MATTDISNVNARTVTLSKAPSFAPYSKVVLYVGVDENGNSISYTAGDDTGRTLHVSNEWGSQSMANNILAQIYGFQYQPYKATGAMTDPATELGDGVNIGGLYSGVYEQNIVFNTLMASELAAPVDEEVEHEYGFESNTDRAYTRMVAQTRSGITQNSREIALQVEELRYDILDPNNSESLQSQLTITASAITQEVSDRKQAIQDEADARDEAISASEVTMRSEIQQTAEAITATVSQEVADRQNAIDALHETVTSEISQSADSIRASVVAKKGGTANSFSWDLQSTYFSLKANNQEVFRADKNGIKVTGSGTFSGKITATSGTIGGITISNNAIYTNGKKDFNTAVDGLHISSTGISLGNGKFKVYANGDLEAENGYFAGYVKAGSILSEKDGDGLGYFDGAGLTPYSVTGGYGGQIGANTIIGGNVDSYTITGGSGGNLQLGTVYAGTDLTNFASEANSGVFGGYNFASMSNYPSYYQYPISASSFRYQGSQLAPRTISFVDGNGNTRTFEGVMMYIVE